MGKLKAIGDSKVPSGEMPAYVFPDCEQAIVIINVNSIDKIDLFTDHLSVFILGFPTRGG